MERQHVRALRPAKPVVDPWTPHGALVELERLPGGRRASVLTAFLSGRECPFTCVFCDLWQYTTDEPTPEGALPHQLRRLMASHPVPPDRRVPGDGVDEHHIKLYNASNFFDLKAVPVADDDALVEILQPFDRVIVESHPKLLGDRCLDFDRRLGSGRLQVAMGLETVHPDAQPRLGKGADLDDYRWAAAWLGKHDIDWRAFVLVGAPFVPLEEAALWAERSVGFAFELGAVQVALIPVRGGNGALETLAAEGHFQPPTLHHLEDAMERCLPLADERHLVTVDTWDLDAFVVCSACRDPRVERLERMNLSAALEPPVTCSHCSATKP